MCLEKMKDYWIKNERNGSVCNAVGFVQVYLSKTTCRMMWGAFVGHAMCHVLLKLSMTLEQNLTHNERTMMGVLPFSM